MINEKRLIDANALMNKAYWHGKIPTNGCLYPEGSEAVDVDDIEKAPTVEAVEAVHGRWEKHGKHDWRCSVCKVGVPYSFTGHNYCHNCGAKMDGGGDNG